MEKLNGIALNVRHGFGVNAENGTTWHTTTFELDGRRVRIDTQTRASIENGNALS